MNKILLYTIWLPLAAMLAVGCGEKTTEPETPKPTLELSNAGPIAFTAQGGQNEQVAVNITTNSAEWNAVSDQTWCVITRGDKQFTLVAAAYTETTADRTATVTVSIKEGLKKTLAVTQSRLKGIVVSPADLVWHHDQTMEQTVTVTTEQAQWSHALSSGADGWVAAAVDGNKLKITPKSANTEIAARQATITFTAGSGTTTVTTSLTLKQEGVPAPTIAVSPTTLTFAHDATQAQLATITTNQATWSHTLSEGAAAWLTAVREEGKLKVAPSSANTSLTERTATITLKAGEGATAATATLTVKQSGAAAATLTINPSSLTYTYDETVAKTVTVETNQAAWSHAIAAGGEGWIETTPAQGSLSVKMKTSNSGEASRTATITFTAGTEGNTQTKVLTITQNENKLTIKTVNITAGTFLMGSPASDLDATANEKPQRSIRISAFRMSKYEITNAQFAEYLNANKANITTAPDAGAHRARMMIDGVSRIIASSIQSGSGMNENTANKYNPTTQTWAPESGYENYPAVGVTWWGAKAFAASVGGKLPAESQWEYACRAGTTTPWYWGSTLAGGYPTYEWEPGSYLFEPHAVGQKQPNAFGLYDMGGNAGEWCLDDYMDGTYDLPAAPDYVQITNSPNKSIRGNMNGKCRSACRTYANSENPDFSVGFRIIFTD